MATIENFYKQLVNITKLENLLTDEFYRPVPDDWYVVITDIKKSTEAVQRGHYKQVNMAGVCSIIAVKNACGDFEVPFIFGGDGATLYIPASAYAKVESALSTTKQMVAEQFQLELRAAIIPVKDIYKLNGRLEVAQFRLSSKGRIAMSRGDGLNIAEALAKKTDQYEIKSKAVEKNYYEGLECRWEPIKSLKGQILTLIIKSRKSNDYGLYSSILNSIIGIAPNLSLASEKNLKAKWPPAYLYDELKIKRKGFLLYLTYALVLLKMYLLSIVIEKTRSNPKSLAAQYIAELSQNTDFIKYDDCLRMVIDVTGSQKDEILKFLEEKRSSGSIYYGSHLSEEALMTCFVQSNQDHIHFVDGGAGGYAMASQMLKKQV